MIKYYSITIPESSLRNECIEEMLRERTTHEIKENCSKQFWLLPNSFTYSSCYIFEDKLNKSLGERIFNSNKKIKSKRYPIFFTIVSTNTEFISWLKIRMGSFLNLGEFKLENDNIVKLKDKSEKFEEEAFTSHAGFYSEFYFNPMMNKEKINNFILKYNKNYLNNS